MGHCFVRMLSILLVICLSLAIAPTALMEETIEPQAEAIEEATLMPVEENTTEPSENMEDEATDDVQAIEEVEEIQIDMVDEPVEESVEEASELPVMEEVQDEAFGAYASDELPVEEEYESQSLILIKDAFPDEVFRSIVSSHYDKNKDGSLSLEERSEVTSINIGTLVKPIRDMTGIKLFPNLKKFTIPYESANGLTSLDVSGCDKLEELDVSNGHLTSLNLTGCTGLVKLYCNNNQLTKIEVSDCVNLKILRCGNNSFTRIDIANLSKLEELDLENCSNLEWLWCNKNKLIWLNIKGCTGLNTLYCRENQLTSLDVCDCTNLTMIDCHGNKLTSLDVSNFNNLKRVDCENNQLTTLNIKGCTNLTSLYCYNNALNTLNISENVKLQHLYCNQNNLTSLDITKCPRIAGHVNSSYFRISTDGKTVIYEEKNEDSIYLSCDSSVKIIGGNPVNPNEVFSTPTPSSTSVSSSTSTSAPALVTPTIAAIKRNSRITITAAPGAVYALNLGGATGKAFKSSKKKVAVVDGNGNVTIRGAGKTKITFKVGKKKRTVTLTVKDPTIPKSVTLGVPTTAVKKGDVITLTASLPAGTNSPIKWKTSNKRVASVANGVVTFKKAGKVTITATATRGKKKAKVTFRVSK